MYSHRIKKQIISKHCLCLHCLYSYLPLALCKPRKFRFANCHHHYCYRRQQQRHSLPLVFLIVSLIFLSSIVSSSWSLILSRSTFLAQLVPMQFLTTPTAITTTTTHPTATAATTTIMAAASASSTSSTPSLQHQTTTPTNKNSDNPSHTHQTTPIISTSTNSDVTKNMKETMTTTAYVLPQLEIPFTWEYHKPPPNTSHNNSSSKDNSNTDYYSNNWTPFGAILRGQDRARVLDETPNLLAFVDRSPQSKTLHALIIPKRYIPTIHDLLDNNNNNNNNHTLDDVQLLYEMQELGQQLARRYQCRPTTTTTTSNIENDYRMVFHVPPYNTVDHLHLHVLCNQDLSIFGRTVKYVYDTPWCISIQTLIQQLNENNNNNK